MTHTKLFIQTIVLAVIIFGCSHADRKANKESIPSAPAGNSTESYADGYTLSDNAVANGNSTADTKNGFFETGESTVKDVISSSAAVGNKNDTIRKFIRTADLKFRVKDVAKATYALEDITTRFDGFVAYTNLFSTISNTTVIPVSADSSLETIYYVVQNTMTIRVPNTNLDSTLKAIAPVVDYLDHRIVRADDVQFQLLENRLKQHRSAKYQNRMAKAVDEKGKRLQETTNAEDKMLSDQEQADRALIENLELKDKIDFSTIQLYIYQREVFRRELIPNDKNIESYSPGFFTKVADALKYGWNLLEAIVLFLAKSWGVVLFITVLVVLARLVFFRRRTTDY